MTEMIELSGVTKDFGKGRGIFDLSMSLEPGVVYGFIGTNGSGKTTTIRNLMGFMKPDRGTIRIKGKDAWKDRTELKHYISYVPGQIEFPRFRTGTQFLRHYAKYLDIEDFTYMERLISRLQLDPSANLRRMSKGMKQKTAIVAALMGDREILILDDSASALDFATDAKLRASLRQLDYQPTIFIVSQRTSSVQSADCILVLDDGEVAGMGTHEQLLDTCSVYQEIYASQFRSAQGSQGSMERGLA